MSAVILGKKRQPCQVWTPETLEGRGLAAVAQEMRKYHITHQEDYIVGRHAYSVNVYADGRRSTPSRIF